MTTRRGDNIPPVSDYDLWNEDAAAMHYLENKYDMEHADEIVDDYDDWDDFYDPDDDAPEGMEYDFGTGEYVEIGSTT